MAMGPESKSWTRPGIRDVWQQRDRGFLGEVVPSRQHVVDDQVVLSGRVPTTAQVKELLAPLAG